MELMLLETVIEELSDHAQVIVSDTEERVNTRPFWVTRDFPLEQLGVQPEPDAQLPYVKGAPYQYLVDTDSTLDKLVELDASALRADLEAAAVGSVVFSLDNYHEGVDLAYVKTGAGEFAKTIRFAEYWEDDEPDRAEYIQLFRTLPDGSKQVTTVHVAQETILPVLLHLPDGVTTIEFVTRSLDNEIVGAIPASELLQQ